MKGKNVEEITKDKIVAREVLNRIQSNIGKVIKGKEQVIDFLLVALLSSGHVLLEDVPGVGKTSLGQSLAKSIDSTFARIQFTPDTLPSDITGVSIYEMNTATFEYHKGPIFHNIILADEINRTSPKTQASLLEAMGEKTVSVDNTTYELPKPFMVIATQNPLEHQGTYPLPEAQIDRFLMKLSVGYPSLAGEREMIKEHGKKNPMEGLQVVTTTEEIIELQKQVNEVIIHDDLVEYVLSILRKTREDKNLVLGASPRATLAVIKASKAHALLKNRDYVIPDDIHKILEPVLLHRFIPSTEALRDKLTTSMVLKKIIMSIDIPVL